jgi:hypothetical protein
LKYARGKKDFVCSALPLFIPKPLKSENQSVIIAVYALREVGNEKQEAGLNVKSQLLSSTNSKSRRLLQAKRRTSRQFPRQLL